ncbi:hypothetical protein QJQ45_005696 [Haematococcus lacustris]|nr:hypothetical protein QJQ45_005696 [Haematococcus lacustris]
MRLHDLLQRADLHAHIIVSAANELAQLKEQLNVAQASLAHQAPGVEQLQQSVVKLTTAVCTADARAVAAEAASVAAAAVAADASSAAHASAALLEQEQQLNAALLEETELLHQHVAIADAATMELEATGIITEPLEQLLSRYFRPVHITNAASETALKPLNNDMVLSMKEEGVSGRIKMTVEDTNSWFSDYLLDDALGAAASHAGAPGGAASHAGALGAAASPAAARGAAASPAAALGAAASPTGALGAAASPHGAQGGAATKPVQAAKQTSQARKVLRAMQRITLPVKLPTREEYR